MKCHSAIQQSSGQISLLSYSVLWHLGPSNAPDVSLILYTGLQFQPLFPPPPPFIVND